MIKETIPLKNRINLLSKSTLLFWFLPCHTATR